LLSECAPGQICRVIGIDDDRALIKRLMGLGVRIGSEIRVLQQRGQDVVVASTGNRIALGGAIARHLQIERLK
jgi:ferrous iron transport protein A